MLYFLLVGVREWKISVVGFPPKDDLLRSKHFAKLSFPMLTNVSLGRASGGWRSKAPLWLAFFTWTTLLGKNLTMDNLR